MSTITITIGLSSNQTQKPLPHPTANQFRRAIDRLLRTVGATVYVRDAQSVGEWKTYTEGVLTTSYSEEARTWVADVLLARIPYITEQLSLLCGLYSQDAIAFTVGTTELVGQRQFATAREG